jgi:hypothetical protein
LMELGNRESSESNESFLIRRNRIVHQAAHVRCASIVDESIFLISLCRCS